jgi:hypothetical protein
MSALSEPLALIRGAQSSLQQCRAATSAWSDGQRAQLDRGTLDPIDADVRRLIEALERAGRDIDQARATVVR